MSPTRRTLALIALLSGLATALVVHAGGAMTAAQKDALAALQHPVTVTALQRGETLVAIAPATRTTTPAPDISPPATDATPASPSTGNAVAPAAAATTATTTTSTATTPTNVGLPKVGHVFVVSLSTPSFKAAFAKSSSATYLRSLLDQGTLLSGYRSLGHGELADELALLSGQAPNPDTTAGCPKYVAFPATALPATDGTVAGKGCVYPDTALTLADQVTNSGGQWGAYVGGMGTSACPTPQSNAAEDSAIPTSDADYDTLHNPFIFFPSLTGSGACYLDEGDTTKLSSVLAGTTAATPAFTYVAPGACADGALADTAGTGTGTGATVTTTGATTTASGAATTANGAAAPGAAATGAAAPGAAATTATTTATAIATATTATTTTTGAGPSATTDTAESATTAGRDDYCAAGEPSGITAEDQFLETVIPQILASRAYKANGVLIIAFSGVASPHAKRPYGTGALVISRWTPKHRRLLSVYTPYAMLHSIEDMLDLQPLATAARAPAFARRILRSP